MKTKAKILILLLSTLVGTSLFAYTIKGLNYVDNEIGTKVTVFHTQHQPLQYDVLSDAARLYVVELTGVDGMEAEVPAIRTSEIQALDVEKLDQGRIRLTFLRQPGVHVSVENAERFVSFLFSRQPATRLSLDDVSVIEDNLLQVSFHADAEPVYQVASDAGTAELVIRNASLEGTSRLADIPKFRHFPQVDVSEQSGTVRVKVASD